MSLSLLKMFLKNIWCLFEAVKSNFSNPEDVFRRFNILLTFSNYNDAEGSKKILRRAFAGEVL